MNFVNHLNFGNNLVDKFHSIIIRQILYSKMFWLIQFNLYRKINYILCYNDRMYIYGFFYKVKKILTPIILSEKFLATISSYAVFFILFE